MKLFLYHLAGDRLDCLSRSFVRHHDIAFLAANVDAAEATDDEPREY
jgi:hypothetical protein